MNIFQQFDTHVLETLYAHRSINMTDAMIIVSQIGEWYVLAGLSLALALWLMMRERFALAQGVLLAALSSIAGSVVFKTLIHRARPPIAMQAYTESGFSFPSAHAAVSFAVLGYFAWLLWQSSASRMVRTIGVGFLGILILAIGFSRLYLSVHYFSDVIGGYILGAACLWLSIWTTKILQRRSSTRE